VDGAYRKVIEAALDVAPPDRLIGVPCRGHFRYLESPLSSEPVEWLSLS